MADPQSGLAQTRRKSGREGRIPKDGNEGATKGSHLPPNRTRAGMARAGMTRA